MKFPRIAVFLRLLADRLDGGVVATSIVLESDAVNIYAAHPIVMTSSSDPERLLELFPGDVLNLNFSTEMPQFHPLVLH